MNYFDALRCTVEPIWGRLLLYEKQEALQAIESHVAAFEKRTERSIIIENMKEGYCGYYNHSDSSYLHISPYALRNPEEAVKTVLHEGRHAYQHDCLDRNAGFPQPILDQFQDGFDNYINPEENFKSYANNFTETDAESFAEQQSRLLNIERDALLRNVAGRTESHINAPSYTNKSSAFENSSLLDESRASVPNVSRYDWENQSKFSALGREIEKVMGGSESETLVQSLRDISMSDEDFQQYSKYYFSAEVSRRPSKYQKSMEICLKNMVISKNNNDEVSYAKARDSFLDIDSYYRIFEKGHEVAAEKANQMSARKGASDATTTEEAHTVKKTNESSRSQAVKAAWEKEADRVRNGKGTWDWTVEQQAELLNRSHTSNPGVSGFEGSHMLSAKDYPEYVGNPDNIQLIPSIAHFDGIHGRNPRNNTPNGIYDPKTGEVKPIENGNIPVLPEIELTDRYDPEQQEFHEAHPDFDQSGKDRHQAFKETKDRHPEKSINAEPTEKNSFDITNDGDKSSNRSSNESAKQTDPVHAESETNLKRNKPAEYNAAERTELDMNMAPSGSERQNVSGQIILESSTELSAAEEATYEQGLTL